MNQVCLTPGQLLHPLPPTGPTPVSNQTVHTAGIRSSSGMKCLCASIPEAHTLHHCKMEEGIVRTCLLLLFLRNKNRGKEKPLCFPSSPSSISSQAQASGLSVHFPSCRIACFLRPAGTWLCFCPSPPWQDLSQLEKNLVCREAGLLKFFCPRLNCLSHFNAQAAEAGPFWAWLVLKCVVQL